MKERSVNEKEERKRKKRIKDNYCRKEKNKFKLSEMSKERE